MNQVVPLRPAVGVLTQRQLTVVKRTVAKDTNADEFDLFVEYCRVKGLDPFCKQAVAVVFSKNDPEKRQMTIITTQDGLRVLASRCGDYRPEEQPATYEYDQALKGQTNPLGIVKATVRLWKQDPKTPQWHPVAGEAYWDEFVPIKRDGADGFEWEATGEVYPEGHAKAGKQKYRKKMLGAVTERVDDSGQWAKMPRNQIAKCARMQALRGGWPETFSGVYAQEEMDRAIALDLTASEMVEAEQEDRRAKAVGMLNDEYPFVDDDGALHFIAAGRFHDHVLGIVQSYQDSRQIDAMMTRNREGLQRFWAKHKADALGINQGIATHRAELAKRQPTFKQMAAE